MALQVKDVMTKNVITIESSAPVKKAAELMAKHSISCIIVIEKEKTKGIRHRNGTEIEAKSLVVSNLSALQSIRLIGEEHLDPNIVRRVKNIRHDRHNVVWGMIAMHELPQYKAASFNPECGKQPRMYIGPRNADYVANQYPAEIIMKGIAKGNYRSQLGPGRRGCQRG